MPNWCETEYYFYSKNRNSVEAMLKFIDGVYSKTGFKDGSSAWEENHLIHLLEAAGHDADKEDIRCRGTVTTYGSDICTEGDLYYIWLNTETAWVQMPDMWNYILKYLNISDIEVAYHAEEPGNEINEFYDTSGKFYPVPEGRNFNLELTISSRLYDHLNFKDSYVVRTLDETLNENVELSDIDIAKIFGCSLFEIYKELVELSKRIYQADNNSYLEIKKINYRSNPLMGLAEFKGWGVI